jgi:ribulose-phosphate 3-epimerase
MSRIPIVPAVIPKDAAEVIAMTKALSFSHEFHLDLVDGKFVEAICWPFEPLGEAMAVKPHTDKYTLEVDLMVENPIKAAREWVKAGADMLVFHIETVDLASFVDFVDHADKSVTVGVSFHGDTTIDALLPYLPHADYVQVMGIHTIGSQGQPFDETTFDKIKKIRSEFPHLPISIDGSVNKETIRRLAKAGVDRLIVGSAIVKQDDPEAAYHELCAVVNEA